MNNRFLVTAVLYLTARAECEGGVRAALRLNNAESGICPMDEIRILDEAVYDELGLIVDRGVRRYKNPGLAVQKTADFLISRMSGERRAL